MVTKHRADLPVLCGCYPLAIYFTFDSVYMSMPLSHFIPAYPSPSPCPQVHSLVGQHLYSCPAPRFFMTFFFFLRFHIYVLAYGICLSLSDLLHSVWQTLGPSTSPKYSIVYMCHIFFIHSSVDGHLVCFHVLAIVNRAAMDIVVHDSFWIMVFSGYMPSSGITVSYGSSTIRF